jgi:tetratricopeptide (TPR) repeat protein
VKALPEARRLDRLEAEIERLRAEIKAAEKSAEEAVKEKLDKHLDAQDKRIGDLSLVLADGANKITASSNAISSASNATSWIVGIGAILLTAGLFGVGLYSVIKVPEQSRLAAEQTIKDYLRSPDAKKDFHNSVETLLGSEIAAIQASAKRGDRLASSPYSEPPPPPSPETEQALLKVLAMPEEARDTDQWRALIYSYSDTKRFEAALALADKWLALPTLTPAHTALALRTKGVVLFEAGRQHEAIAAYDDVIQRFGTDPAPALRDQVAKVLVNKGVALANLSPPQPEAEIAAYDAVIQRFGSDPAPALRELVAMALVNKGVALSKLTPPQPEAAIAVSEEVIQRFGTDPAPALREQVAQALVNKGIALGQLSPPKTEEEIAAYESVIERFATDPAPALREAVARALHFKAITLKDLNRPAEARAVCEDYLRRFADAPELEIQETTAEVRALLAELPPPPTPADP